MLEKLYSRTENVKRIYIHNLQVWSELSYVLHNDKMLFTLIIPRLYTSNILYQCTFYFSPWEVLFGDAVVFSLVVVVGNLKNVRVQTHRIESRMRGDASKLFI